MAYFTNEFLRFLSELSANNDRDWFNANKKRYEDHVKKPFEAFVQHMIDEMQQLNRNILITPKDAIFRIYRDTRFSNDKTPYKTFVSAIVSSGGRTNKSTPGIYIQFSAEDARVYSGAYEPDKNELQNIRAGIASNLKEFNALINDKSFKSKFGEIQGEKNKRIPKEFEEAAKQQPLIANKQFYYFAKFEPEIILDPKLPKIMMDHFKVALPLGNFLWEASKG
jgi:uncharacterized protein (TIGR02453 family)